MDTPIIPDDDLAEMADGWREGLAEAVTDRERAACIVIGALAAELLEYRRNNR